MVHLNSMVDYSEDPLGPYIFPLGGRFEASCASWGYLMAMFDGLLECMRNFMRFRSRRDALQYGPKGRPGA